MKKINRLVYSFQKCFTALNLVFKPFLGPGTCFIHVQAELFFKFAPLILWSMWVSSTFILFKLSLILQNPTNFAVQTLDNC